MGYAVYRVHGLPWFRSISWFFLVTSNYFIYGESLVDSFAVLLHREVSFLSLITATSSSNRFSCHSGSAELFACAGHVSTASSPFACTSPAFCGLFSVSKEILHEAVFAGESLFLFLVASLISLFRIGQFAWTHVTLLIVVTQSYLIIQNMFEGLIWFVVPVSMIVTNDVMAYLFGFFFGKNPSDQTVAKERHGRDSSAAASPPSSSAVLHIPLSVQFPHLVCPIKYAEDMEETGTDCEPHPIFRLTTYSLPATLSLLCRFVSSQFCIPCRSS